jgi:hypothetical protein
MEDLGPEEQELIKAVRRFGYVKRVTWLLNQLADRKFGKAEDMFGVTVNQSSKRWTVKVTKGDFIEY